MPRRFHLPPRVAIRPFFTPGVLAEAMAAARLPIVAAADDLARACTALNVAFRSFAIERDDHRNQLRRVQKALLEIAAGRMGYLMPLIRYYATGPKRPELGWLRDPKAPMGDDPVVLALRSGLDYLDWMTGQGLTSVDDMATAEAAFRAAARLTAESHAAGLRRSDAEHHAQLRRRNERFAWEVIDLYRLASGQAAGFSRHPDTSAKAGEPAGPLIRFMLVIYASLRRAAAGDASIRLPAEALAPQAETLAEYIQNYPKTSESAAPNRIGASAPT